jgi:transcriptional regulator with XRE-family HTH domain
MQETPTNAERRRKALANFLRTRRTRLTVADVGLPEGSRRRTPGLRREEVAQLANVSTAWYTWLEQARDIRVSEKVLEGIAAALRLDGDERAHLFVLGDRQGLSPVPPPHREVGPVLQQVLDTQGASPAYVTGPLCDVLAWNQAACAVFGDFSALPGRERNLLWRAFTDAGLRRMVVDWENFARDMLAAFRAQAGRYVGDPWFTGFVADLEDASPEFTRWWPNHDVRRTPRMGRQFDHPVVGRLALDVASFQVVGAPDAHFCVYTAPPGSESAVKLQRLARLSSAHEKVPTSSGT